MRILLKDRRPMVLATNALRSEDVRAVRQLIGLPDADAVNVLLSTKISGHKIKNAQHQLAPITRKNAVKYLVEEAQ